MFGFLAKGNSLIALELRQDGFGFVSDAKGHHKVPQVGMVVIHNDVEIGAGSTIASFISYGIEKAVSKHPEKFGTGHIEGIIESGASKNSALASAWIPALVFGIPGDSITAIVIGVLYLKGMNPGPTIFIENPQNIYAVFIVFFLANVLMIPLGLIAIKLYKQILRVPRRVLMPMGPVDAMEFLIEKLKHSKTNVDFFDAMNGTDWRGIIGAL